MSMTPMPSVNCLKTSVLAVPPNAAGLLILSKVFVWNSPMEAVKAMLITLSLKKNVKQSVQASSHSHHCLKSTHF